MSAKLLDGKKIKSTIITELKKEIAKEKLKLGLAIIQIGEREESNIYIRQKEKTAKELGIAFNHYKLKEKSKEEEILSLIDKLNEDNKIDGIILQLPIPDHYNIEKLQNRISHLKDIDGQTLKNKGQLFNGNAKLISPTAGAVMRALAELEVPLKGKNIVIINRSNLVGKPLAMLLLQKDATITICHSKTENLIAYTKQADILIVAIGHAEFINKDMIKKGAIIIDVGINRKKDGTVCGDVAFDTVKEKSACLTPTPGGIGPLTVAFLYQNLIIAHKLRTK